MPAALGGVAFFLSLGEHVIENPGSPLLVDPHPSVDDAAGGILMCQVQIRNYSNTLLVTPQGSGHTGTLTVRTQISKTLWLGNAGPAKRAPCMFTFCFSNPAARIQPQDPPPAT